jgi:Fe-S cluster assembly iron-binding protein IscA
MLTASEVAARKLQEQLVHKCAEMGIGFRVIVNTDKSGMTTYSIKLDRQHQEDKVKEIDGVKMLLDQPSAALIDDYELDYIDQPDGGFMLRKREPKMNKRKV